MMLAMPQLCTCPGSAGTVLNCSFNVAPFSSPQKTQGIWWIPEATDAQPAQLGSGAALRAAAAAAAGGGEGGLSGPELLKLAASMRMNTGGFDCGLRVGWEGGQLGVEGCLVPSCSSLRQPWWVLWWADGWVGWGEMSDGQVLAWNTAALNPTCNRTCRLTRPHHLSPRICTVPLQMHGGQSSVW